jgi:hypothetical protein
MLTWNDLFVHGTLIKYSTHLWRARIQLKPEDLGIEVTNDVAKALSFGVYRLAPSSAFETINAVVHRWEKDIKEYSLEFPLLEGVRYVPDDQVQELKRKLDLHLRDFNNETKEFLQQYERMLREQIVVLDKAIFDVTKSREMTESAISRITLAYPSQSQIESKFGLEWDFFTIAVPASKNAATTAKNAVPQIKKVVTSMVEQLRSELATKVSDLLELARGNRDGKGRATRAGFGESTKKSTLAVLEKMERLNFLNDEVISEQTRLVRNLLEQDISEFDAVISGLDKAKSELAHSIAEAAKEAEDKLSGLGNRRIKI